MLSFIYGNIFYTLLDSEISNFLALKTLTHGTNIVHNLGIRLSGAQPSKGGDPLGSTVFDGSRIIKPESACTPEEWRFMQAVQKKN